MTAIAKIKEALVVRGEDLTTKQMTARYGTTKPSQIVYLLRNEGYEIFRNRRVDTKGRVSYKYRAGKLLVSA